MKFCTLAVIIFIIISSCTYNKIEIKPIPLCDGGVASYQDDIVPIIKAKCSTGLGPGTGCHDAWILTYSGVKGIANNGQFMETCVIEKTMPKIPNNFGIVDLTEKEINLIVCWLEYDAPEN